MAEIKVEKKNSPWGWIIGVLLVLGIIAWFLFSDTDGAPDFNGPTPVGTELGDPNTSSNEADGKSEAMEAARAQMKSNPDAQLSQFSTFIGDKSRMGLDHEYTNEAMIKLVNAVIERAVVMDVDIDTELESAIEKAEAITNDPMDTNHADKIKKAYLSITDVIEKIQTEKFPQLSNEVEELRQAAHSIDPAVLTLDQKEKVNRYFDEAADALQKMNTEI